MMTARQIRALLWFFLAVAVIVGTVLGVAALGQTPPQPLPAGLDPNTAALLQLVQASQAAQSSGSVAAPAASSAISVIGACATVLLLARQFAPAILGAPLSELRESHAKTRARTATIDRELQKVRIQQHWMGQCMVVMASKLDCDLPPQPPIPLDPQSDGN